MQMMGRRFGHTPNWPTMTGLVGGSFGASFSLGANSERIAAVIHEGSEVEDSLLVGAWNIADGTSFCGAQSSTDWRIGIRLKHRPR
jgi:hypothetical protein